ncbi:MAG: hypothetical protein L3J29_10045 [Cyclobacteriaceae bacterium]|nr:hypothetical protein [Cyclobacteriaceae bacterium]
MRRIKSVLIVIASCFFVTTVGFSQVTAIATYTFELPNFEYDADFKLIINSQLSNFQHHQEATEFTTHQGYLLEFPKNYYDWIYDSSNKTIVEQRVLKDGTKVIANWAADLTWEITEETKEIVGYKVQKAIAREHYLRDKNNEDWDYGDAIA